MIKNYSNRNYIKSVKSWGAGGPSPKNNNNWIPILVGATITAVIVGINLKNKQKQINLLRMNLVEANNRNNAMQREMDILAEENLAATTLKETVEKKFDQVTID